MHMGCVQSPERSEFLIRFYFVLDTSVRPVGTRSEMDMGVMGWGEGGSLSRFGFALDLRKSI